MNRSHSLLIDTGWTVCNFLTIFQGLIEIYAGGQHQEER